MSKRFLDQDLLAYKRGGEGSDKHVTKHKQRNKALEIVFDPAHHKEYVTGFRKRKQQRRKEALKNLEKKHRVQRLEERAERRQAVRAQLPEGVSDSDEEPNNVEKEVHEYQAGGLISVVTVAPIARGSDSEGPGGSDSDEEERVGAHTSDKTIKKKVKKVYPPPAPVEQSKYNGHVPGSKMSKTALRVMSKTKLKIEGKRSKGGVRGKAKGAAEKVQSGGRPGKRKGQPRSAR